MDVGELTIDWSRCVHIDEGIDQNLVRKITPAILTLRQQSKAHITVAINSGGGSLAVLDTIEGLLTGPDQDGSTVRMVTVVTNRAYSAAAVLLAMGSYAVALPHTEILFHDVRFGGLEDVTPESALVAAKQLRSQNERSALSLANLMFRRWMWNYLDVNKSFNDVATRFPKTSARFAQVIKACSIPDSPTVRFDLAAFATHIFSTLSAQNECLIENAMEHLRHWGSVITLASAVPTYRSAPDGSPGTLDGARLLYESMTGKSAGAPFGGVDNEGDLNLFLMLAVSRVANSPNSSSALNFEHALGDFLLVKSIDDPKHVQTARKVMLRHKPVFFSREVAIGWEDFDEKARSEVVEVATPVVKAAWLLCVLVARELFNGEHRLTPREAMCLGVIDEVAGDDSIESRRQFRMKMPDGQTSSPKLRRVKSEGSTKSFWRQ